MVITTVCADGLYVTEVNAPASSLNIAAIGCNEHFPPAGILNLHLHRGRRRRRHSPAECLPSEIWMLDEVHPNSHRMAGEVWTVVAGVPRPISMCLPMSGMTLRQTRLDRYWTLDQRHRRNRVEGGSSLLETW